MTSKGDSRGMRKPLHHITLQSETLRLLRERPRTTDELPGSSISGSGGYSLRDMTRKIGASSPRTGTRTGTITPVYYLHGDERRGVRRFIEENETAVRRCMELDTSPDMFALQWPEERYIMLCEEWQIREHEREDEEDGDGR